MRGLSSLGGQRELVGVIAVVVAVASVVVVGVEVLVSVEAAEAAEVVDIGWTCDYKIDMWDIDSAATVRKLVSVSEQLGQFLSRQRR